MSGTSGATGQGRSRCRTAPSYDGRRVFMKPSPRWKKLGGDIAQARGRLVMMVIGIALGVVAVASISTAYTILEREIARNYLATNPAAAPLDVEHLDETVLAGVRAQAGIT